MDRDALIQGVQDLLLKTLDLDPIDAVEALGEMAECIGAVIDEAVAALDFEVGEEGGSGEPEEGDDPPHEHRYPTPG